MKNEQPAIYQKILELERKIGQLEKTTEAGSTPQAQQTTQQVGEIQKTQIDQIQSFNKLIESLKEAQPSWQKDGVGLRGFQPASDPPPSSPAPVPSFSFNQEKEESQKLETTEDPVIEQTTTTTAAQCIGLALYTKIVPQPQVWIGAGTVAGQLPSEFDPVEGKFIADNGSGEVWVKIEINENTGAILERSIDSGNTTPSNTSTLFYYPLGYYEYIDDVPSVTNYGCGSLDVTICRNWFAANPPFYGVTFSR